MPSSRRNPPRHESTAARPSSSRIGRGRTILVVDDEPAVLEAIRRALRGAGYAVVTAADGRHALRIIFDSASTPALVLADIEMPEMTGVELAARLAAARPGLPVILMSGSRPSANAAEAHPDVIRAVILKPFAIQDLVAVVDRVLVAEGASS